MICKNKKDEGEAKMYIKMFPTPTPLKDTF